MTGMCSLRFPFTKFLTLRQISFDEMFCFGAIEHQVIKKNAWVLNEMVTFSTRDKKREMKLSWS